MADSEPCCHRSYEAATVGLDLAARSAQRCRLEAGNSQMPQSITTSVRSLVEKAEQAIETLLVADAIKLHGDDSVVLVDIRDIRELQRDGRVPGAFHCPRGMLEFWIDPESPYHKDVFAQDKRFVFFCAGGLRSALAADTAQRMGLKPVAHIKGGFGAWKKAGGPVEDVPLKT
jgi:rhodanese-related sulfurtransferase